MMSSPQSGVSKARKTLSLVVGSVRLFSLSFVQNGASLWREQQLDDSKISSKDYYGKVAFFSCLWSWNQKIRGEQKGGGRERKKSGKRKIRGGGGE